MIDDILMMKQLGLDYQKHRSLIFPLGIFLILWKYLLGHLNHMNSLAPEGFDYKFKKSTISN